MRAGSFSVDVAARCLAAGGIGLVMVRTVPDGDPRPRGLRTSPDSRGTRAGDHLRPTGRPPATLGRDALRLRLWPTGPLSRRAGLAAPVGRTLIPRTAAQGNCAARVT